MESCQEVWSPHLQKDVVLIEGVQRRATKLVDNYKELTYKERLKKLDLPTLAFRRQRGDMIQLYKHFHSYDKSTLPKTFKPKVKHCRNHDYQLERVFPKDGVRGIQYNSFYYRSIKTWNDLPRKVVHAESLDTFKRRLDEYWKDDPLKFNHLVKWNDS